MDQEPANYPEYREYSGGSPSVEDKQSFPHSEHYNPYADQYEGPAELHSQPTSNSTQSASQVPPGYQYDPGTLYGSPSLPSSSTSNPTPSSPSRSGMTKQVAGIGSLLVVIGGWLLKLQGLVFVAKFALPALSALLTVALYSTIFGWPFAFGFVASIFIHEMGHALVMKSKGVPVNGMVFVPFLGAAVFGRRAANAKDEAEIGIAGPVAGALAASVCLALAYIQPGTLWAPLAYLGFFINLFNMLPILPLDGGHVLGAVDRRVWILGFVALLGLQIWMWLNGSYSWWLLLIVVMAAFQIRVLGFAPRTPEERAFYDTPLKTRLALTFVYFALAAVLFMGMSISHSLIPPLSQ